MRVLAKDLSDHDGAPVVVSGWVHRVRALGAITFVVLRDRSGLVQVVFDSEPPFGLESVVRVFGTVQRNAKAPGGFELQQPRVELLAPADRELPLPINQDLDAVGIDALLDHRIVSLRNPKVRHMFELQSGLIAYFADYLRNNDFTEIKSSKIIGSGTEGGTGLFTVDYFGRPVYLAQSPQFYKQAMVASGMERVFEIGAAYRAEKHDTPRHLNEYVSLDVEIGFIESEADLMDLEAELLAHMFASVARNHAAVLSEYGATVPTPEAIGTIPRIDHDRAKAIVTDRTGKRVFEINPEGERVLCEWALAEHGVEAVFVFGFPRKKRPFYTYPEGLKTRSFDLLFRGLEITTGGQRIHRYDELQAALPKFGLTLEGLGDYPKIFQYGCPPHGGFAIGLERLTQQILGRSNVKEASLFPRDRRRVRP